MYLETILEKHRAYRSQVLNLIASENAMSPTVERWFTPELSHRYGDYLGVDVGARKYTGNRYLTELDRGAQEAVRTLFQCRHADLRPLSGHIAGVSAIMALCRPGDTVLELDAKGGGHRLAEKLALASLCPLRVLPLPMNATEYNIDVEACVAQILAERPRLVILGSSLFLFPHPVAPIARAVHSVGGALLYDASHILGLIAGGAFPNPLQDGADIVSSSTHKTFAGPQGGLIITNDSALYARIVPAIYPALVTNHHLHRLPALWAACEEWRLFGREHARAIVANAQALGAALAKSGLDVVAGSRGCTETHTLLVVHDDAKHASVRLEAAGILVTPVGLPDALGGGALRLGVQEVTRRGMTPEDAPRVASLIAAALNPESDVDTVADNAAHLTARWTEWRFTWDSALRYEEEEPCAS